MDIIDLLKENFELNAKYQKSKEDYKKIDLIFDCSPAEMTKILKSISVNHN